MPSGTQERDEQVNVGNNVPPYGESALRAGPTRSIAIWDPAVFSCKGPPIASEDILMCLLRARAILFRWEGFHGQSE